MAPDRFSAGNPARRRDSIAIEPSRNIPWALPCVVLAKMRRMISASSGTISNTPGCGGSMAVCAAARAGETGTKATAPCGGTIRGLVRLGGVTGKCRWRAGLNIAGMRRIAVNLMEASMKRFWNMLCCAIALATVLSLTGAPAWARRGGDVVPCELSGVNPAYHKTIFGKPEVAAKYGFVKGPDGKWQVIPNCHISS
jgi:hypothetical protein